MAQFIRAGRNKWTVRYSAGRMFGDRRRVIYKTINGTKRDAKDWVATLDKERREQGTVNGISVFLPSEDYGTWLYALRMCIPDYPNCPIKVGLTTDPRIRKKHFVGAGPFPVEWIGCWPAPEGRRDEMAFHERFREYRLVGEWFQPHEEVLAAIRKCLATPSEVLHEDVWARIAKKQRRG